MSKQPIAVSAPGFPDAGKSAVTLPYTYVDPAGDKITIDRFARPGIQVEETLFKVHKATADLPKGDELAKMLRALLAAAGDTKYRVVSDEEIAAGRPAVMRIAAEAMREQILAALFSLHGPDDESAKYYADVIRALPLIPDADDDPGAPEPLTSPEASEYQSKIEALRSDLDTLQEVVRDLGSALHDHIQTTVDHLQQDQVDALASAAEAINRRTFTVNDDH